MGPPVLRLIVVLGNAQPGQTGEGPHPFVRQRESRCLPQVIVVLTPFFLAFSWHLVQMLRRPVVDKARH